MVDYSKVRYAVLVAVVGIGVSLIPGFNGIVSEWIRNLSVVDGALWAILRIGSEFIDNNDPMMHTWERSVDTDFWSTLKRAL